MKHLLYATVVVLTGTLCAQQEEQAPCHLEPIQCFVRYPYPQDDQLAQEVAQLRKELALLASRAPITIEIKDHDKTLNRIYKVMRAIATLYPFVLSTSMIMQYASGKRTLRDLYYTYGSR